MKYVFRSSHLGKVHYYRTFSHPGMEFPDLLRPGEPASQAEFANIIEASTAFARSGPHSADRKAEFKIRAGSRRSYARQTSCSPYTGTSLTAGGLGRLMV